MKTQINEWSDFDPGIKSYLTKQGYKFLGKGVDQQAYQDKDNPNYVLKIFGYGMGMSPGDHISYDQKMLYLWAKFCEKNSRNPYLPKFYGIETFKFKGNLYLQYRQEKLLKNTKFNKELLQSLTESVDYGESFNRWVSMNRNLYNKLMKNPEQLKQLKEFYDTAQQLKRIGRKHDFMFDLHEENIMMRADTTPVITDPWVVD